MRLPMSLGRHYQYLKYVVLHKLYVARAGAATFKNTTFRSKEDWHALFLCLLHDNNKFHPAMWSPYAEYFYKPDGSLNTTIGPDGYTKYPPPTEAFRRAWLWHIKRSRHHPQYWVDVLATPCGHDEDATLLHDDNTATCTVCWKKTDTVHSSLDLLRAQGTDRTIRFTILRLHPMPEAYITEMLCDWIGAGQAQGTGSDIRDWYMKVGYKLPLHASTRAIVEKRLGVD